MTDTTRQVLAALVQARRGAATRGEVADDTGLSSDTVGRALVTLLGRGYVAQVGVRPATGRPAVVYAVTPSGRGAFAVGARWEVAA